MIKPNFISYFTYSEKDYLSVGFYDPFTNKKIAI